MIETATHNNGAVQYGTLVVVIGPTGVGKTDLCLRLATHLDCAIISCDSRQIYREMPIGTAAPTPEQLARVKHYFIATRSIQDNYNAGQYELDALKIIADELTKHATTLLTGGSMLYVDAVCRGIDNIPTTDPNVRANVHQLYEREGIDGVRRYLKLLDPQHYATVDLNNVQRMLHAIEVCLTAGCPYSALRTGRVKKRPFNILKIGLERPRSELNERINLRVLQMMADGLETEACALYPMRHLNALNTVGFKELFAYFDGFISRDEAIRQIQRNTRHYAKKQMTWFKHDMKVRWFHPDDYDGIAAYTDNFLHDTSC